MVLTTSCAVCVCVQDGVDMCHGVLVPALIPHLIGTKQVASPASAALDMLGSLATKPHVLMGAYAAVLPHYRTNSKLQAITLEKMTGRNANLSVSFVFSCVCRLAS
jgi:hypothetical protein